MRSLFRFTTPIWVVLPLLGLTLVVGLGGGYVVALEFMPATNCPESPDVCDQFTVFWQAWDIASEDFVDASMIDSERMIDGAVNGMLGSLGDHGHTRFLSAEAARHWRESLSGEFEGIGVYIRQREDGAIIVTPIEGTPADQAGMRAGDVILAVDGDFVTGWTLEELSARVRGPRGSNVTLTVQHLDEEEPVDITIRRDTIEVPSVAWAMLPGDVALVRLSSFARRSADEMETALQEAREQGARAIIFDLRNNPGGIVNEAIAIASEFLPADTVVLLEESRDGEREASRAGTGGVALDLPMVVLVNEYTASSAEIVSGALQDAGRAQVIGVRTVGTGTVLTTYNLEGGAQLLLGTKQWLTPDGRLIRNQGIAPDIQVGLLPDGFQLSPFNAAELSLEELEQGGDAQLARALRELESNASR